MHFLKTKLTSSRIFLRNQYLQFYRIYFELYGMYRSTRTAWLVTQWTEVPPSSGAHLFVVSGSVQIVYNRAKISASSFK
jgi:hypothetical protein